MLSNHVWLGVITAITHWETKSIQRWSHLCGGFDKYESRERYKPCFIPFHFRFTCILSFNDQNDMKHVLLVSLKGHFAVYTHRISVTYRVSEKTKMNGDLLWQPNLKHVTNRKQLLEKLTYSNSPALLVLKAMSLCLIQYDLTEKCFNYPEWKSKQKSIFGHIHPIMHIL